MLAEVDSGGQGAEWVPDLHEVVLNLVLLADFLLDFSLFLDNHGLHGLSVGDRKLDFTMETAWARTELTVVHLGSLRQFLRLNVILENHRLVI